MPSTRAIRAGNAFVELSLRRDKFTKDLARTSRQLKGIGAKIAGTGAGLVGGAIALATPFIPAIKAASDYQETLSKFDVVFGEQSGAVRDYANNVAKELGRSREQVTRFLASSQDLFVPIGFDATTATDLSKTVTQLAIDLASFNNTTDDAALRDLQAALTGSGETMKKYGVIVSEAAVKQQLLNTSIDPKAATEQEKAYARLQIILAGTTAAQGDAARTADSSANRNKALRASVADLAATTGSALLPGLGEASAKLRAIVSGADAFVSRNQGLVRSVAIGAVAIGGLGAALVTTGVTIGSLGIVLGGVGTAIAAISSPIGIGIAAVAGLGVAAYQLSDDIRNAFGNVKQSVAGTVGIVTQTVGAASKALARGDIELAARIAFLGLKAAAAEGTSGAFEAVNNWRARVAKAAEATKTVIVGVTLSTWTAVRVIWENLTGSIERAWLRVQGFLSGNDTAAAIEKSLADQRAAVERYRGALEDELGSIGEGLQTKFDDIDSAFADKSSQLQGTIANLRKKLDELSGQTIQGPEVDTGEAASRSGRSNSSGLSAIQKAGQDLVAGVTSSFALRSLDGGAKPLTAIEKNTAKAARTLDSIFRLPRNEPRFG